MPPPPPHGPAYLFQNGPISGHVLILGKFRWNVLEERRTEGRSEPAIVLLPDVFNVHELSLSESARLTDWDAQPHLRQIYDTFTAYGTHDGETEHARMTTFMPFVQPPRVRQRCSRPHHDHQHFGYKDMDSTRDVATGAAGFVICESANTSTVLKDVWAFAPKTLLILGHLLLGAHRDGW